MALLNNADAIYLGANASDRVYLGADLIWPSGAAPVQYMAAAFVGNTQYARSPTIALGGANPNGATNFEVQALVYIDGAPTSEDRVFMVQFPASRQAGLFVSNLYPTVELVTGDSQAGSSGGYIGSTLTQGTWAFLTFSANGTAGASGLWRGTIESLDGTTIPFTGGGRAKGVETSLQGNRVDLNGGGVDNGWPNRIRYAEVRVYNAQRTDAQRQLDKTNIDPTGAMLWWRFSDNGSGGLAAADITGNGRVPTIVGAALDTGPLF